MSLPEFLNRETLLGIVTEELDIEIFWEDLYQHYYHDMPYGWQKARTGDPLTWIYDRLCNEYCEKYGDPR